MVKVQKISELQPFLGFTEFDLYQDYKSSFLSSDLGRLHSIFPFKSFCRSLGLSSSRRGRHAYFSPEGKVALMLLKAYTGFSDATLIEHLSGNIHLQIFCGVYIHPCRPLTNYKIVSAIRSELACLLNVDSAQQVLALHWKPYLDNLHVMMTDATCYESYLRYPTSVKLLWESVAWLQSRLSAFSKDLGQRCPRNKFKDVSKRYLCYSKKRKRKQSRTRMMKRGLLRLLEKQVGQVDELLARAGERLSLPASFRKRFPVIRRVLEQEKALFAGQKVSDRIVSVDKPHLRPIVRGKETKTVEFGAKVNNIQVDGISFIEHLSFNAFNEGTRLQTSIALQERLLNTRVSAVAADAIYATNANRKFCTKNQIYTSFVRKGKPAADEPQRKVLRSTLSRARATRLEGSFGTQKQHYSLDKIKARKEETEILWIFFGIHVANAACMVEKVKKKKKRNTT